jgi:hypothetical protein
VRFPIRVKAAAIALLLTFASHSAAADPPPLASSLTGGAKAAYDAGKLLYDDKDYAGASTKYRAAYGASHDARLLWNIATCEKELRHYAQTAGLIERFIHDAPALVSPEYLAQARVTLAALRGFYSPVTFSVQPAGTHLFVDGEDVGVAPIPGPLPVDLGKHAVRAEHEGFLPFETALDVAGQNEMRLDVALVELSHVGQLVVTPSDPGDTVTLDEKVVGSGRWQGDILAGTHHVKVTAPGKKAYVTDVDLTVGEHRSLDVTLESEHPRAIWPWVVGGAAAVIAGGVVASVFLLKPGNTIAAPSAGAAAPTIQLSSWGRLGHLDNWAGGLR